MMLGQAVVPQFERAKKRSVSSRHQSRPGRNVPSIFWRGLGEANVLLLGAAERPNLIALDGLGSHVANRRIMEGSARIPALVSSLETVLIETLVTRETDRNSPHRASSGFVRGFLEAICSRREYLNFYT
jgi:hypothetical protein